MGRVQPLPATATRSGVSGETRPNEVRRAGSLDLAQLEKAAGAQPPALLPRLCELIEKTAGLPEPEKLARVNEFFNDHISYVSDQEQFDTQDQWSTPLGLLRSERGDCEDLAIAKYMTLRALGVPDSRLRITYVRAQTAGRVEPHMVLAYHPSAGAQPLVLDNLTSRIQPACERRDLSKSVYSFNAEHVWVADQQASYGPSRLSRWVEVLAQARREGFVQ